MNQVAVWCLKLYVYSSSLWSDGKVHGLMTDRPFNTQISEAYDSYTIRVLGKQVVFLSFACLLSPSCMLVSDKINVCFTYLFSEQFLSVYKNIY